MFIIVLLTVLGGSLLLSYPISLKVGLHFDIGWLMVININKCVYWYDVSQLIYRDELSIYNT